MTKRLRLGRYRNYVKKHREALGITQYELARRLVARGFKASGPYISQIEAGLKHVPYGVAIAITEALEMDASKVTEIFLPSAFTDSEGVAAGDGVG